MYKFGQGKHSVSDVCFCNLKMLSLRKENSTFRDVKNVVQKPYVFQGQMDSFSSFGWELPPFGQGKHSVLEWCFGELEMLGLRKENLTFRDV